MRRRTAYVACAIVLLAAACAKKAPPSATPLAPKYPEFLYPAPAAEAPSRDQEEQQAAWNALQSGQLGDAERRLTKLLTRSPGSPSVVASLGYVALARRDYDRAISRFDAALSGTPALAPALVGRGLGYAELGRPRDAIASFEAAQQADPALQLTARIEALRFRAVEDAVARARTAAGAGRLDQARAAYTEALDASPDSPLLLRELAVVERKAGQIDEARQHLERAAAADPADRQSRLQLADLAESQGQLDAAIRQYESAQAIERTADVETRLAALRERAELARLPKQYRAIGEARAVTRADIAALVGVRLPGILRVAPPRPVPLVTDVSGSWAARWIEATLRAGIMEPFPNHTFQPGAVVRRSDLAMVVSRLLSLVAVADPPRAGRWQRTRATLTDIPPSHPAYDPASRAVGARVLDVDRDGAFNPMRQVGGAEAIQAVDRLAQLAGPQARADGR